MDLLVSRSEQTRLGIRIWKYGPVDSKSLSGGEITTEAHPPGTPKLKGLGRPPPSADPALQLVFYVPSK